MPLRHFLSKSDFVVVSYERNKQICHFLLFNYTDHINKIIIGQSNHTGEITDVLIQLFKAMIVP